MADFVVGFVLQVGSLWIPDSFIAAISFFSHLSDFNLISLLVVWLRIANHWFLSNNMI